jgi:hypothetical protein
MRQGQSHVLATAVSGPNPTSVPPLSTAHRGPSRTAASGKPIFGRHLLLALRREVHLS